MINKNFFILLSIPVLLLSSCNKTTYKADLIIYGCTSAGISAAVEAKRLGHSVIVVGPDTHLGGLTAGGLTLLAMGPLYPVNRRHKTS